MHVPFFPSTPFWPAQVPSVQKPISVGHREEDGDGFGLGIEAAARMDSTVADADGVGLGEKQSRRLS